MRAVETSKFRKLRKKLKEQSEKEELKNAVIQALENPDTGKNLKGEFRDLKSIAYNVKGQSRRLIYKAEKDRIVLLSFGPREGIYR